MSAGSWQYYGTTATGESKKKILSRYGIVLRLYLCMYVCVHGIMYVCMYVYVCVQRWLCSFLTPQVAYVSKGGCVCVYVR